MWDYIMNSRPKGQGASLFYAVGPRSTGHTGIRHTVNENSDNGTAPRTHVERYYVSGGLVMITVPAI